MLQLNLKQKLKVDNMIKYKVIQDPAVSADNAWDDNNEVLTLVNIEDNTEKIMAAPDEFTLNEIVGENEIDIETRQYTDDQGFHTGWFAYKK